MNILLVTPSLTYGGVQRLAIEQCRSFIKLGHDARLLSLLPDTADDLVQNLEKHAYRKWNFPFPIYGKTLNLRLQKFFLPAFHDWYPDVIIAHNFTTYPSASKIAKRYPKAKLGVFLYEPASYPSRAPIEKERAIVKELDFFITQSKVAADDVETLYGIRPKVIHPGCNPLPTIPDRRGDFVLCATRIHVGKEIELVASACKEANAKVVFAGLSTPTTDLVKKRVKETGLKDYEFILDLLEDQLIELYKSCRLYCLIHQEHFGMLAMEAASCGSPLVCNTNSGSSELFKDGVHGFFLKGKDYRDYVGPIMKLMENERLAYKMGRVAWERCKEWTWIDHAKALIRVLKTS